MRETFEEYFRCVTSGDDLRVFGQIAPDEGFFSFGADTLCYGQSSIGFRSSNPANHLYDVSQDLRSQGDAVGLPFDLNQIVENLRMERYVSCSLGPARRILRGAIRNAYYVTRPLLPVAVRKHLQKVHLNDWRGLTFPRWPVDTTVDRLMEKVLAMIIRGRGEQEIPFVWFWPNGASACAVMTHDVETELGVQLSSLIMDMDDSFGVPGSFQIVPEKRYKVTQAYLNSLRERGFEINIQGLNHDGHLFKNREDFKRQAAKINKYARDYGAVGFRSPVLYRNLDWIEYLEFEYDSSVPNVAHLDPQRGGCCTVMPYFVGDILELPVTMTQDYSLLHILNDNSLNLWKQQSEMVLNQHGLINAIVHPDYMTAPDERELFTGLLKMYVELRDEKNVWLALPGEVNSWWRQRSRMNLLHRNGEWRIEGPGSERARLGFARVEDDRVVYRISETSADVASYPPIPIHQPLM